MGESYMDGDYEVMLSPPDAATISTETLFFSVESLTFWKFHTFMTILQNQNDSQYFLDAYFLLSVLRWTVCVLRVEFTEE